METAQRYFTIEDRWRAHGKDDLAQQRHLHPIAIGQLCWTFHHSNIDAVAPQVGLAAVHRSDPHLDLGMERCESAETRDQPPSGKCRRSRDSEDADPALAAYPFAGEQHGVEPRTDPFEQRSTINCQLDPAVQAPEQRGPEVIFKRAVYPAPEVSRLTIDRQNRVLIRQAVSVRFSDTSEWCQR